MTGARLLAASIVATTALFGATAAIQAASQVQETAPRPQAAKAQANPFRLLQGEDRNDPGAVDDDYDGDEFGSVEDQDRKGRGQSGEDEAGQNGKHEGEDED